MSQKRDFNGGILGQCLYLPLKIMNLLIITLIFGDT